MKVQARDKVNFKSTFFDEPKMIYGVLDSGALGRNTDRILNEGASRAKYINRLAMVDRWVPPKGIFSRALNSFLKVFVSLPREAKKEPITQIVDLRGQWRKRARF